VQARNPKIIDAIRGMKRGEKRRGEEKRDGRRGCHSGLLRGTKNRKKQHKKFAVVRRGTERRRGARRATKYFEVLPRSHTKIINMYNLIGISCMCIEYVFVKSYQQVVLQTEHLAELWKEGIKMCGARVFWVHIPHDFIFFQFTHNIMMFIS
jgi:hypothetical protein